MSSRGVSQSRRNSCHLWGWILAIVSWPHIRPADMSPQAQKIVPWRELVGNGWAEMLTFLISNLWPFRHPQTSLATLPGSWKTLSLSISFERILKNCSVPPPQIQSQSLALLNDFFWNTEDFNFWWVQIACCFCPTGCAFGLVSPKNSVTTQPPRPPPMLSSKRLILSGLALPFECMTGPQLVSPCGRTCLNSPSPASSANSYSIQYVVLGFFWEISFLVFYFWCY